jgi:hypothetical protein
MSNEQIIRDLIQSKPKHYSKIIQNNVILWQWVLDNSTTTNENPAVKIYSAITRTSGECPNGKHYKYRGPSLGWGGCGRASVCQCAKNAVSLSVSEKKANRSQEDIDRENRKREETNKKKYGVSNIGQTTKAIENHKAFYADKDKVLKQVAKGEKTMLDRYGVTNAAYLESAINKSKITNLTKYGAENAMQNSEIAKKSGETRRSQWDPTSLRKLNYRKFVDKCERDWNVRPLMLEKDYEGVYPLPLITFQCITCGCKEERKLDYGRIPICKVCNPPEVKYESAEEIAVREYVKTIYNGNLKIRDRSIINPYELDMVLLDKNLAIEYCGLYWHSELSSGKKWSYHEQKMKIANAAGLRLITIFSDEWNNKQDIVKAKLLSIIGSSTESVGARKCKVKSIDRDTAFAFHQINHIQGSPKRLKDNIGLFFNNELISVGSFNIVGEDHVLSRFSSSKRVIGGCGKITAYYVEKTNAQSIVSFADLRWSEGGMYQSLGYSEESRVPPMQTYVPKGYSSRVDKRAFTRDKINPDNLDKTEWQIMQELGYDRIWDCGKIKYRLDTKIQEKAQSSIDLPK